MAIGNCEARCKLERACLTWKALKFISFKHSTCQTKQIYDLVYTQGQSVWDPIPSLELEKILFFKLNQLVTSQEIFLFRASGQWISFQSNAFHEMQKQRDKRDGPNREALKNSQPICNHTRPQASTPEFVLLLNWKPCLQPKWFPTAFWTVQSLGAGESHIRVWLFRWEQQARNGDFLLSPINILIEQFSLKMFYS